MSCRCVVDADSIGQMQTRHHFTELRGPCPEGALWSQERSYGLISEVSTLADHMSLVLTQLGLNSEGI
eukprot:1158867-Pelagomonas_calceolata.AAC.16